VEQSLRDGYLVGSRGSVGSSLVGYFANITEVNPLPPHYLCPHCRNSDFNVNATDGFDLTPKACPLCGKTMIGNGHNVPFETFLGFEDKPKIPDIDLNFCSAYQLKAHDFVRNMFGESHTFRAGTISEIKDRIAYGYVKNYFEINETDHNHTQAEIN
jgi:DNA polymerase-3 subunit alpha (Gram-positive type)